MTLSSRLGFGLITLSLPLLAFAAPGNVTGITAVNEGGKVRVQWQPVTGSVESYRIFYSHASILDNGGLFDDFEAADGTVNSHLLQNIPPASEIFVSVLAVDAQGEESPYFVEEAHVVLSSSSAAAVIPTTSTGSNGTELRLLKAEAISATGVLLTFSHQISIPQTQATEAIVIENGSGITLSMRRFVLVGDELTVHTVPQERGIAYRVRVSPVITGKDASGTVIPLAGDQAPMLFAGHATGTTPVTTTAVQGQRADVTNLRISAQAMGNGTYDVTLTWDLPSQNIAGYEIMQTMDGGRSFGQASSIQKDAGSVKIPGVPAGTFGMLLRTVYPDGTRSSGIAQMLDLPGTPTTSAQGNITQQPSTSPALPNSGPALWLLLAGISALVGAWDVRRRNRKASALLQLA